MTSTRAAALRKSIENLINVKLADALSNGGLDRLKAHRISGVTSPTIRFAQRELEHTLEEILDLTEAEEAHS